MACARSALKQAYAPYSHFPVGAALLTVDGITYTGCNIENASFGATNCAERTAIFKAVSEGHDRIAKLAVAAASLQPITPCGICRQVMAEFMDDNAVIILEDARGLCEYAVSELLPAGFRFE